MSKQSDLVSVSQGASGDPLYIDTTNDRVGIGTSSPASVLHVNSGASDLSAAFESTDPNVAINLTDSTTTVQFGNNAGVFQIYGDTSTYPKLISAGGGEVVINEDGLNIDFRVESDANSNAFVVDAGTGNVGIGTSSPAGPLEVESSTNRLLTLDADSTAGFTMLSLRRQGVEAWRHSLESNGDYSIREDANLSAEVFRINTNGYLRCPGVYNDSAADSANVVVDGSGNIYRSTSALKYKQDIRDIEDIDISQFRPVRYKSNLERDDQTKDHFGFIADEAHDAGYTELVSYGVPDEETGVAEVEGFRYDRMTVLLTKVIQQQQATIDALEARVAALEAV